MGSSLAIFGPVFTLAFWTFVVLNVLGFRRIRAGRQRQVEPDDFKLGESDRVPEQVRLANRNYMNLLELPVLFYAVSVIAYITGTVSIAILVTAWLFVALRVGHSLVHLSTNNVTLRLRVFVAANTALLILWVLAALSIWGKSAT